MAGKETNLRRIGNNTALHIPGLTPSQIPIGDISTDLAQALANRDFAQERAKLPFLTGTPTRKEARERASGHKATSREIGYWASRNEGNRSILTSIAADRKLLGITLDIPTD